MIQIQTLKVLFTQDFEAENLFCCVSPGSSHSLFFSRNLLSLWFEVVQDDFQYDFTWMTVEADDSAVLASRRLPFIGTVIISG